MLRNLIICISLITLIVTFNILTQKHTNNTIREMNEGLTKLKDEILNKSDNVLKQMEKVDNIWNRSYQTMAYYIEHDELEKVGTELATLKSNLEIQNEEEAIPLIEKTKFILEHIREKVSLNLKNVF